MAAPYNLLFDGNNFFYKTVFSIKNPNKGDLLETRATRDMFLTKLVQDFSYLVRFFEVKPKRIVFTVDATSWRKSLETTGIDSKGENMKYKGNRKEANGIDWPGFYDICDIFCDIIKDKYNIIIHRDYGMECDDLIYVWSDELFKMGENSIIISADGDLNQLVNFSDKRKNYVIQFTPTGHIRRFVYTKEFLMRNTTSTSSVEELVNSDNTASIFDFDLNSGNKDFDVIIKRLTSAHKNTTVDPTLSLLSKIIEGDTGDNIAPVVKFTVKTKTGKDRTVKISERDANTIANNIVNDNDDFNIKHIENYSNYIFDLIDSKNRYNDYKLNGFTLEVVGENLKRNMQLIMLHSSIIPAEYLDKSIGRMKDEFMNKFFVGDMTSFNKYKILKNTPYETKLAENKQRATKSDFFKLI